MKKRAGVFFVIAFALVAPSISQGQAQPKAARVGFLLHSAAAVDPDSPTAKTFRRKLGELGWIEGKNLVLEMRFAQGKEERVPGLIADLIRLNVDVMVLAGSTPVSAGRKATTVIPIVMTEYPAPERIVASLARPGGNITGVARCC